MAIGEKAGSLFYWARECPFFEGGLHRRLSVTSLMKEKNIMSSAINPEAAQPSSTLAFEQSDRNPQVTNWNGNGLRGWAATYACGFGEPIDASGPSAVGKCGVGELRRSDSADGVEDEAEREG